MKHLLKTARILLASFLIFSCQDSDLVIKVIEEDHLR